MPWSTSNRRRRLPRDWSRRVRAVQRRARGRCEAATHEPECDGLGSQCDHKTPGDDHSLGNLQWLSAPCHEAKTRREARAALASQLAKAKHPTERHPGLA